MGLGVANGDAGVTAVFDTVTVAVGEPAGSVGRGGRVPIGEGVRRPSGVGVGVGLGAVACVMFATASIARSNPITSPAMTTMDRVSPRLLSVLGRSRTSTPHAMEERGEQQIKFSPPQGGATDRVAPCEIGARPDPHGQSIMD